MVFENLKKLESVVNSFAFSIKISCQSKEFPLSKQSPLFSPTPPFLEKIFHPPPPLPTSPPPPIPLCKGGSWNYEKKPPPLFLTGNINLDGIY